MDCFCTVCLRSVFPIYGLDIILIFAEGGLLRFSDSGVHPGAYSATTKALKYKMTYCLCRICPVAVNGDFTLYYVI